MKNEFPYYLSVLAALGPLFAALATLIVGLMVATIAYRQLRTAQEKLVLDLFERRIAVYEKLESAALRLSRWDSKGDDDAMHEARQSFLAAKFLFGGDAFVHIYGFMSSAQRLKTVPLEVQLYNQSLVESTDLTNRRSIAEIESFRNEMPNIFEGYLRMDQKLPKKR